jgi:hypothetical protein
MKIRQRMTRILFAALLILPGLVHADAAYPALDIHNITGTDTGATLTTGLTPDSAIFDIDATVVAIVTDGGPNNIPNQDFSLTSTGMYDGDFGLFSGSFVVGGGLLTGTFTDLPVFGIGSGYAQFNGGVTYTGGTLMGSLTGGTITGTITGSDVIAKLGAVVPVPAAIWLFGSGLIGFIAVARRKSA